MHSVVYTRMHANLCYIGKHMHTNIYYIVTHMHTNICYIITHMRTRTNAHSSMCTYAHKYMLHNNTYAH